MCLLLVTLSLREPTFYSGVAGIPISNAGKGRQMAMSCFAACRNLLTPESIPRFADHMLRGSHPLPEINVALPVFRSLVNSVRTRSGGVEQDFSRWRKLRVQSL